MSPSPLRHLARLPPLLLLLLGHAAALAGHSRGTQALAIGNATAVEEVQASAAELAAEMRQNIAKEATALEAAARQRLAKGIDARMAHLGNLSARQRAASLAKASEQFDSESSFRHDLFDAVEYATVDAAFVAARNATEDAIATRIGASANDTAWGVVAAFRGTAHALEIAKNNTRASADSAYAAWNGSHDALHGVWSDLTRGLGSISDASEGVARASRAVRWDAQASRLAADDAEAARVELAVADAVVFQAETQSRQASAVAAANNFSVGVVAELVQNAEAEATMAAQIAHVAAR